MIRTNVFETCLSGLAAGGAICLGYLVAFLVGSSVYIASTRLGKNAEEDENTQRNEETQPLNP